MFAFTWACIHTCVHPQYSLPSSSPTHGLRHPARDCGGPIPDPPSTGSSLCAHAFMCACTHVRVCSHVHACMEALMQLGPGVPGSLPRGGTTPGSCPPPPHDCLRRESCGSESDRRGCGPTTPTLAVGCAQCWGGCRAPPRWLQAGEATGVPGAAGGWRPELASCRCARSCTFRGLFVRRAGSAVSSAGWGCGCLRPGDAGPARGSRGWDRGCQRSQARG